MVLVLVSKYRPLIHDPDASLTEFRCMGRYTADLIIKATLCHLMQNYKLSMLGSQDEWVRDKESWISHPDFYIACIRK